MSHHECSPLPPFELERFFAKHEFSAPYLACCSDCEPLRMSELLALADEDARMRWEELSLGYTETHGLPALREAVAAHYHSPAVSPENLVICAPEEGVYLSMRALLRPGDRVVCTFPGYQSLYSIAESIGCQVVRWEPQLSVQGISPPLFNVDALEDLVKAAPTRLVVVNFPHNPTGALLSHQNWDRVIQLCCSQGCYLFSDEMYRFLELSSEACLESAADKYEWAISLNGCSKALALPGLRIGWVACRDSKFMEQLLTLKDYTTICASAPSEVLALIAVRAASQLTARNLAIIKSNIEAVSSFASRWSHVVSWAPPAGGSVAFPRFALHFLQHAIPHEKARSEQKSAVEVFTEQLVAQAGVLLLPASVYGRAAVCMDAGHFRLGLGRKNLPECLQKLEAYLQRLGV